VKRRKLRQRSVTIHLSGTFTDDYGQPKFLTKEQRAQLAIERRTQELREQREKDESKRREREALEKEANDIEKQSMQNSRYDGGGGRCAFPFSSDKVSLLTSAQSTTGTGTGMATGTATITVTGTGITDTVVETITEIEETTDATPLLPLDPRLLPVTDTKTFLPVLAPTEANLVTANTHPPQCLLPLSLHPTLQLPSSQLSQTPTWTPSALVI
jgi:hypothetical protein